MLWHNQPRRTAGEILLSMLERITIPKAVGASGTDHNRITQNNLLRMMDGDRIEFGAENSQPAFSVSCERVYQSSARSERFFRTSRTAAPAIRRTPAI